MCTTLFSLHCDYIAEVLIISSLEPENSHQRIFPAPPLPSAIFLPFYLLLQNSHLLFRLYSAAQQELLQNYVTVILWVVSA